MYKEERRSTLYTTFEHEKKNLKKKIHIFVVVVIKWSNKRIGENTILEIKKKETQGKVKCFVVCFKR
jgi:hypothetical protein